MVQPAFIVAPVGVGALVLREPSGARRVRGTRRSGGGTGTGMTPRSRANACAAPSGSSRLGYLSKVRASHEPRYF